VGTKKIRVIIHHQSNEKHKTIMQRDSTITITGDNYVTGFDRQLNEQAAGIARLHLEQFIQDYERAFQHKPTAQDLSAAFRFVDLFMQELETTYPGQWAKYSSHFMQLIKWDPVTIAENLARFAPGQEPPPASAWFE
jgi:hypothetical protein